jgi:hypothetical protein
MILVVFISFVRGIALISIQSVDLFHLLKLLLKSECLKLDLIFFDNCLLLICQLLQISIVFFQLRNNFLISLKLVFIMSLDFL